MDIQLTQTVRGLWMGLYKLNKVHLTPVLIAYLYIGKERIGMGVFMYVKYNERILWNLLLQNMIQKFMRNRL